MNRGPKLKAYLLPKIKEAGHTQESFAAAVGGLSKAAPTGWWKTGKIGKDTLALISVKLSIPLTELYEVLGMKGMAGSDAALGIDPELAALLDRATPRSRNEILRIAKAAADGLLTEADTELLRKIADRFTKTP